MSDHQHCINCLETAEGFYSYPCQQCGWSPDQYNESGLYLSPGTILNSQYQIARMLGHGGFGITYLAWDNLLHRRLAIKEYMPRDFATRNATNSTISVFAGEAGENFAYGLERFLDEARTLAKFQQHAGIVSVLNVFYSNSTGYMVMEYVEGRTLKDYLMEKGNLSWELTLQLFMPIMDALREVHKSGILHRDISPDNIYLCNDNRVKLLDFGAARYALGGHSQSLSVVVKPGYAPEEQYRAKGKQGAWTDVYSVAASMYRCIAGVVPPDALDRLDEDELISPSDLGIPMPEKSEAALMTALAIKANDRTQNIETFQKAIWKQINNSEPVDVKAKAKKVVPPASTQNEPITNDLTGSLNASAISSAQENESVDPPKKSKKGKVNWVRRLGRLGVTVFISISSIPFLVYVYFYFAAPQSNQLKMDHAEALYDAKDYKNALTEFNEIAASRESSDFELKSAQNALGFMYQKGFGVNQDYQQAVNWYQKSAEQGSATGQANLGNMYNQGLGVTIDQQQAFNWYKKSAEQGFAFGQENLGEMYRDGLGVNQDYQQAVNWFKKSADQGNASGQANLALMYNQGLGVTPDQQQAFNWTKKAAEQGHANGQKNLGILYENGWGVKKNKAEAIKWYQLAAAQGNADASSALKKLGVQ
jgi:TPR repeat protein/predicted Ser/Thr protein kinase